MFQSAPDLVNRENQQVADEMGIDIDVSIRSRFS